MSTPHYSAPPRPAPSQARAVWALVLTLLGGCCCYVPTVIGIVMGFKAINRSELENVDHGRGLGAAAVCVGFAQLGALVVSLTLVFGGDLLALDTGGYAEKPANADASRVEIADLHRRDCFSDARLHGGKKGVTRLVDCDRPHDAEVFDVLPIQSGSFPGLPAFKQRARDCRTSFADYVGVPVDESRLAVTWYYPTKQGWVDPSTRVITCVAMGRKDQLTGSVWRTER